MTPIEEIPNAMKNTRPFSFALCCEEPFRVFFPLGLLLGVIGVALWPLFFWHVIEFYPALAHMRLMIEGLMGAFIIGFLGTAGPRLLDAQPLSAREFGALLVLEIFSAALHLAHLPRSGDLVFLALLLAFVFAMSRRFRARQDLPPPNFALVVFGLLNAVVGLALVLVCERLDNATGYILGSLMLNIGFVLFPILGVGAFLFPRFLGGDVPSVADLRIAADVWQRNALAAVSVGVVIWISFALEAFGFPRSGALIRGVTTLFYFVTYGRLFYKRTGPAFLAQCFRIGAISLSLGLLLPALLPNQRVAELHLVFIGGFMVILLTVGTRVILGHSGQSRPGERNNTPYRFLPYRRHHPG